MIAKLLLILSPWKNLLDRFEKAHPMASMVIFQIAVGVLLLGAVGAIALAGGSVIWLFYHFVLTL